MPIYRLLLLMTLGVLVGCGTPPPAKTETASSVSQLGDAAQVSKLSPEVVHKFLAPYLTEFETVTFFDEPFDSTEDDLPVAVVGRFEATKPGVWYLIEHDYVATMQRDSDSGQWAVSILEFDGHCVFVDPTSALTYVALKNVLQAQKPLRPKPGAVAP